MKIITMPLGFLGTNCHIVEIGNGECVLFDAGSQPEKLISFLGKEKLTPIFLFLTHGHFDHIGAVRSVRDRYKDIKVVIHELDEERLYDENKSASPNFNVNIGNQGRADILLKGQKEFKINDNIEMKILYTPGHTEGGVCYIIDKYMITGDTLFRLEVGRTDLYGGDYNKLMNSMVLLNNIDVDYIVCPGHGENSTIFFEQKNNQYLLKA